MTKPDTTETVARAIADQIGDGYDNAFRNKREWIDERCVKGGRSRDINEPFQVAYDDAAKEAVAAHEAAMEQAGWVWVPKEPTKAMCEEGAAQIRMMPEPMQQAMSSYCAMVEARPK